MNEKQKLFLKKIIKEELYKILNEGELDEMEMEYELDEDEEMEENE